MIHYSLSIIFLSMFLFANFASLEKEVLPLPYLFQK